MYTTTFSKNSNNVWNCICSSTLSNAKVKVYKAHTILHIPIRTGFQRDCLDWDIMQEIPIRHAWFV